MMTAGEISTREVAAVIVVTQVNFSGGMTEDAATVRAEALFEPLFDSDGGEARKVLMRKKERYVEQVI